MAERDGRGDACAREGRGSDAFAYDPARRASEQSGLDRLRCVADREIAELLFKLYGHIKKRETALADRKVRAPAEQGLERLRNVGRRALAGDLGPDLQDLAEHLLRDECGRERTDDESFRAFCGALARFHRTSE